MSGYVLRRDVPGGITQWVTMTGDVTTNPREAAVFGYKHVYRTPPSWRFVFRLCSLR